MSPLERDDAHLQVGVRGEAGEAGNLETKSSTRTGILAEHFCCCRGQALCVFCLGWNRTIRSTEARRADSLLRQSMGGLKRGAI